MGSSVVSPNPSSFRLPCPVEVVGGPLKGVFGRLMRKGAHARLILAVDLIGQAVSVEVDAAGASIKDSFLADVGITQENKINAFGSVTGRAGFAFDAALLYAKGGFAWANAKTSFTDGIDTLSDSQTHTGYTIGGGLEYLFTPSWSAKAEYMYTSLGGETYTLLGVPLGSGNIDFHTIKVGVNYHFR